MTIRLKKIICLSGASICMVLFQNCAGGVKGVPNGPYSFTALEDNELFTIREGLVFSGEYSPSQTETSQFVVCDFPSRQNCINNSQGTLRGQTRYWETGLNPSSPLHKLTFRFRSNGYFQRNERLGSEILIGLRGRVAFDSSRIPIGLNGRGVSLGSISSANSNCERQSISLTSFFDDAHQANNNLTPRSIFTPSCSDQVLQDGIDYRIEVFASHNQQVGMKVYNSQNALIHSSLILDTNNSLNPNLTGAFFSHRRPVDLLSANEEWDFTISDIQINQSDENIESYFQESRLAFYLGQSALTSSATVSSLDLNSNMVSFGSFQDFEFRTFYCLADDALVTSGTACQNSSDFDQVDFSSHPLFVYNEKKLSLQGTNLLQGLPVGTYQLVIRTNPESVAQSYRLKIQKVF